MFESLSDRLGSVVSKLRDCGRLSEADVDVKVGVVRSVLARIRWRSVPSS
jgi:signal recognition particle GTPase